MEVQIELASEQMASELAVLSRQTFVDAFEKDNNEQDFYAYVDEAFQESTIHQELVDPKAAFFVAYEQDSLVGYLKLRFDRTPSQLSEERALELQRIYVQQSAVGNGIGAQLMQTALDYAQANYFTTLWLGVWEHNSRAIAFYEKWGFRTFSSHLFMMGNDPQTDLLMKRTVPPFEFISAQPQDLAELRTLLQSQQLPVEDLNNHISFLLTRNTADKVVGCCGLESYSSVGLLRSLAVDPVFQGKGLGKRLVQQTLAMAKEKELETIYLLTTTAADFFQKIGFNQVSRTDVPMSIQQTREFAQLCPDSAVVMRLKLASQ